MYAYEKERSVESVCYKQEHINKVLNVIKNNFMKYFEAFIDSEGLTGYAFDNAKKHEKLSDNKAQCYKNILCRELDSFNDDRQNYLDIFDEESLEEHQDDPASFKSKTMRNECPIIRKTLNAREKALEKYKRDFNVANANALLDVVINLFNFSENYIENVYEAENYDLIADYTNLEFSELDTENCTLYGVIGGGIKSHLLYKVYPSVFPNRSRLAVWALWYLTNKEVIDCEMDSEFLMIDTKANVTAQNYFYPYELFSFYAHQVFQLLNAEAKKLDVYIDTEFRYIIVDSFFSFVANKNTSEIEVLTRQIKESDYYGY